MKNENKVRKRKPWIRILAIVLVLTMIFSYWSTSLISIKIASDSDNAAMSYLAGNTEYVNESKTSRLMIQLRNKFKKPTSFADYYELASTKIAEAKYEEALGYVEECIKLISNDPNHNKYSDLMIKKGCLLTLLGRGEEAIEPLRGALELEPDNKDIYLVLAQIYYDRNEIQDLGEILKSYLELASDDVDMRVTYMQTLFSIGEYEEADKQLDILGNITTGQDETVTNEVKHFKVLTKMQLGDFKAAYDKLCEMDGLEETYTDIYMNKGICKMSLGEYEEAVEFYTTSIDKGQNVQYCYYTRGICKITGDMPDYEAAYGDLKAAAQYEGIDRDEETAALANELIEQAFVTETK